MLQIKINQLIVLAYVCYREAFGNPLPSSNCTHEMDILNRQRRLNSGFQHTRYLMTDESDFTNIPSNWIDEAYREAYSSFGERCPSILIRRNHHTRIRSTCPWFLRVTYNASRIPMSIRTAFTYCNTCVGSNGEHKCIPLYHKIKILVRTADCGNGFYVYKKVTISIVKAYTCAISREFENSRRVDDFILNDSNNPIALA